MFIHWERCFSLGGICLLLEHLQGAFMQLGRAEPVTKQQVDFCRWQAEQKLLLLKIGALSQHLRQCSVWQREQVLPLKCRLGLNFTFTPLQTVSIKFHSEHHHSAPCPMSCGPRCCLTVHKLSQAPM